MTHGSPPTSDPPRFPAARVGNQEHDLGTGPWRAVNGERAADLAGALPHAEQSPVPAIRLKIGIDGESAPIIHDREPYPPGLVGECEPHRAGGGVLHHVRNSLLQYPEQNRLDL